MHPIFTTRVSDIFKGKRKGALGTNRIIKRLFLGFSYLRILSFGIILPILWTRYAHALLKLQIHNISSNTTKTTYLLAQLLWMN